MNSELPAILTLLLCVGSVGAWGKWVSAWQGGSEPLFPIRCQQRQKLPQISVALGALFLCLPVAAGLGDAFDRLTGPGAAEPPRETTLLDVQIQLAFNLFATTLLGATLLGSRDSAERNGIVLRDFGRQLRNAGLGFLLAIGPVYVVLIISEMTGLRGSDPEHELLRMLTTEGTWRNWLWVSVTAIIAAPLAEELLFRLLLQGWLEERLPPVAAIAISSLLFCLVHRFPDSLALLPLALVLGYVQYRRRSYLTVFGIHALFNAVNLLLTALAQ